MDISGRSSDAELVAAVHDGDVGALRELYERHAPWLCVRLTRRCNDPEVVDDALQDTFITLWRQSGSWRGDGEVAAWLWGIAFRTMVSRLRRRRDVVLMPGWEIRSGALPGAEDHVLTSVEYGDLGSALRRLSPDFRAVVQACILDGLTTREASRLLGVREATVKTRLHRAKRELRSALADTHLEGWR